MEIKQYPNPDCRGFTIEGDGRAVRSTEVVVYRDSVGITQYWLGGSESYAYIEGREFRDFMSGIEQCLKLLGDSPNKTVEELKKQIDEVEK